MGSYEECGAFPVSVWTKWSMRLAVARCLQFLQQSYLLSVSASASLLVIARFHEKTAREHFVDRFQSAGGGSHTGFEFWPKSSTVYLRMHILLSCTWWSYLHAAAVLARREKRSGRHTG